MNLIKLLIEIWARICVYAPGWANARMSRSVMMYRTGKIGIGGVLTTFVIVIIGVVLAGPFRNEIINPVNETGASMENYTGGALAIAQQVPLFYILLIVALLIAPVAKEFSALD